eukprot:5824219-Pyramimonas_sp.AAC.1
MPGLSVAVGHREPAMGVSGTCPCCFSRLPCSARLSKGSSVAPTDGGAPPDLVAVGRVAGWAGVGSSPRGVGGSEWGRGEAPP